jgi:23S rRNA C2498 (ribose-2'-O)-methylase RlmM
MSSFFATLLGASPIGWAKYMVTKHKKVTVVATSDMSSDEQ